MAHFRRNKPRIRTFRGYSARASDGRYAGYSCWTRNYPAWHDILYHRRPHRRETKAVELKIMRGLDDDAALWPLSKKPHQYYW